MNIVITVLHKVLNFHFASHITTQPCCLTGQMIFVLITLVKMVINCWNCAIGEFCCVWLENCSLTGTVLLHKSETCSIFCQVFLYFMKDYYFWSQKFLTLSWPRSLFFSAYHMASIIMHKFWFRQDCCFGHHSCHFALSWPMGKKFLCCHKSKITVSVWF